MKKLSAIQNIARLMLVIVLAAMLFLPPMTLTVGPVSVNTADYITEALEEAFSDGVITKEVYDDLSEAVEKVRGPGDEKVSITNEDKTLYATMNETGEEEKRFVCSQSILDMILSFSDAFTLMKGEAQVLADGQVEDMEAVAQAVNENSVQTFMLSKLLVGEYASFQITAWATLLAAVVFLGCFVCFPVMSLIFALKEISAAVKNKGEWLFADSTESEVGATAKKYLIPLGSMLIMSLALRGSSLNTVYFVAIAIAAVWLLSATLKSLSVAMRQDIKPIIPTVFFAVSIILGVVLGAKLLGYDALTETFNEENMVSMTEWCIDFFKEDVSSYDVVFMLCLPRIIVAICFFIVLKYLVSAIVRLATTRNGIASVKFISPIFVVLIGILYGIMTSYSGGAGTVIALGVSLFAVELIYSIYADKGMKSKANSTSELIQRAQALKDCGKMNEEVFDKTVNRLKELSELQELKFVDRLELSTLEDTIVAHERAEAPISAKEE